jgi:hypothetical protein
MQSPRSTAVASISVYFILPSPCPYPVWRVTATTRLEVYPHHPSAVPEGLSNALFPSRFYYILSDGYERVQ